MQLDLRSSRRAVRDLWPRLVIVCIVMGSVCFMLNFFVHHGNSSENQTTTWDRARLEGPIEPDDPALIDLLRKEYLLPPAHLPYNLSSNPFYIERSKGYGWKFADNIIKAIFRDEYSKFFVEAGGLDGEFLSNSLWLEQSQGWSGLLVEPEPQNFRNMIYKRRKCWIVEACLSDERYPKMVEMVSTEKRKNQTNLDREAVRGGAHQVGSHGNSRLYELFERSLLLKPFSSQCFPLYSLLLALNRTTIDFLSLDIQGLEMKVFETLPLDKVYIRSLLLEHEKEKFDWALYKIMREKGFRILEVGGSPDYFFVHENETLLLKKYPHTQTREAIETGNEIVFYGFKGT